MIDESRYAPQLDDEYEQMLKAQARHLEVWVTYEDGRRIKRRTFMDTPEGRQSATKNADTWMELPLVERVDVVPVGAGRRTADDREEVRPAATQGVGADPQRPRRDPAPTRAPRCCAPRVLRKPSGPRLCHSIACPDSPGEPISVATYAKGREWPAVKP